MASGLPGGLVGKPELSSVLATGFWLGALIGTRCLGPKER